MLVLATVETQLNLGSPIHGQAWNTVSPRMKQRKNMNKDQRDFIEWKMRKGAEETTFK